ncbi:hypothetical protein [Telmatospirillum sp.]|uniref:hypothetical protein n=1 Tax=Telmatospirillum sp. TaxID=2079197 RepID=UPI0028432B04|nr:hypothetical protein [Telmatospirillum sp.]MDR3438695.1 hypothetical protein [Telmatospirillum sp.]
MAARETDAATGQHHHHSSGNWALQGDIDALVNDLHGLVQVANGEASAVETKVSPSAAAAASAAATTGSGDATAGIVAGQSAAAVTASDQVAGTTLETATYGFVQNLQQALQSYGSTAANSNSSQTATTVTAIG